MKMEKHIEFIIELKRYLRNLGKTSFISKTYLDLLFVKYNINVKELEKQLEEDNNPGNKIKNIGS